VLVQRQIRNDLLEFAVFLLQLFQTPELRHPHAPPFGFFFQR
jgi:hypothetical protein